MFLHDSHDWHQVVYFLLDRHRSCQMYLYVLAMRCSVVVKTIMGLNKAECQYQLRFKDGWMPISMPLRERVSGHSCSFTTKRPVKIQHVDYYRKRQRHHTREDEYNQAVVRSWQRRQISLHCMVTSSHEHMFNNTVHLRGDAMSHGWILLAKSQHCRALMLLLCHTEQAADQAV